MNIHVISADRRLLEALRLSGDYTSVTAVGMQTVSELLGDAEERKYAGKVQDSVNPPYNHGLDEGPFPLSEASRPPIACVMPGDVWLVSDILVDMHETIALQNRYPHNKLIYLFSNHVDSLALKTAQTLCAAHGIYFVLPYHTPEQAAGEVTRMCLVKERPVNKVITAVGALPQLGLTSSLIGLGTTMAKLSGLRIGIFGLNGWNAGDSGLRYTAKYLDELWGSLQGRQLQAGELLAKMQMLAPNVYYLAGNRDLKKLYYYKTDGVSWLIEKAREAFDFVLLDAGSYPDHALAAQSIHASDLLLVQLNQGLQAKIQWRRMHEHILQPVFQWDERQTMLLFNKMYRAPDMENEKQLSRQLDMPYLGSLPYVASFHRNEADGTLVTNHYPEYEKELHKVGRAILHYYQLQPAPAQFEADRATSKMRASRGTWFRWMKSAGEA